MTSAQVPEFRTVAKWLSSFAVLLAFAVFSAFSLPGAAILANQLGAARYVYYVGVAILFIAPIAYALGRLDISEIAFGVSVFLCAISMFAYKTIHDMLSAGDKSAAAAYAYIVAYVMLLLIGIIIALIGYFRLKGKLTEILWYRMLLTFGVLYLIEVVCYAYAATVTEMTLSSLFTSQIVKPLPHTFVMGGVFSLLFSILLIIYSVVSMLGEKYADLKKGLRVLVLFTILAGITLDLALIGLLSELFRSIPGLIGYTVTIKPPHFLSVLTLYAPVISPLTVTGAIFLIIIIYHVMVEYVTSE